MVVKCCCCCCCEAINSLWRSTGSEFGGELLRQLIAARASKLASKASWRLLKLTAGEWCCCCCCCWCWWWCIGRGLLLFWWIPKLWQRESSSGCWCCVCCWPQSQVKDWIWSSEGHGDSEDRMSSSDNMLEDEGGSIWSLSSSRSCWWCCWLLMLLMLLVIDVATSRAQGPCGTREGAPVSSRRKLSKSFQAWKEKLKEN